MSSIKHTEETSSNTLRFFIKLAIVVVLILAAQFFLRNYIAFAYEIPSSSMEPVLKTGDRVFTERISYYFRDIEAGDIITFDDPEPGNSGRILIKRCIAVGGQEVDLRDGLVYIDGVALDEEYIYDKPSTPLANSRKDITYPYKVPEGFLWVMGDNRTNSKDSRYFGPIPVDSVHERALITFWPPTNTKVIE